MSLQKITPLGTTISLENGTSGDATPNLLYKLNTTAGEFILASATGGEVLGVLQPNEAYESGVTPDNEQGTLVLDGVVDITCGGTIALGDYVKANSSGQVISAGYFGGISAINTAASIMIVGKALEAGVSSSKIAVLMRPQLL